MGDTHSGDYFLIEQDRQSRHHRFVRADPLQFAASQRDQGVPGELCAVNLLKAFPQLGVSEMARAMAKAGYPATDTATGLKVAYPAISPVELSTALVLAYQ